MHRISKSTAAAATLLLAAGILTAVPAQATDFSDSWGHSTPRYGATSYWSTWSKTWTKTSKWDRTPDNYMYVWAGADGRKAPDRLFTFGFDPKSKTYGKLVYQTLIPEPNATGNEPHHCGISADSKTLICGGLMSAVKDQDWLFFFDLSDPAKPRFTKSMKSTLASYPDDFIALPDNSFLLTEMGAMDGASPGRLATIDAQGNITGEYPENPPENFNPHGVAARLDMNIAVTCDYIDPKSTLNTTEGPALIRSSVEVFDLRTMEITQRIQLPEGTATMDCKMLNHDSKGRGYVGGSGNGKLYLFDPIAGTATLAYDVNKLVPHASTQYMQISMDDTRLYVPYYSDWTTDKKGRTVKSAKYSGVVVLDVSNPEKVKLVQNLRLPKYAGPHMSMLVDGGKKYLVTDYLLDQDDIGKIHYNGDHYVRVFKVNSKGRLSYDRFQVDLDKLLPGLKFRPHGVAVTDMGMDMEMPTASPTPTTEPTTPTPTDSYNPSTDS